MKLSRACDPPDPNVSSCGFVTPRILATIGTGLQPFFDWFAGSSTMTVLEVDPIKPILIPDTMTGVVRVDFDWLSNRFRDWLSRPEHLCTEA